MRHLLIICSLFLSIETLNAQLIEQYFNDTFKKSGGQVYCHLKYKNTIIMGGKSFDKMKYNPVLIRLDTLGNTMWNTSTNDNTIYGGAYVVIHKFILGMDGFIYAACNDDDNDKDELWKVNPENGAIIWKKPLKNTIGWQFPRHIIDVDSVKFLVSYMSNNYHAYFSYISKSSGDTLATYVIGDAKDIQLYGLCLDKKRDIYYSSYDTLYKVSGDNPRNRFWKKQHKTALIGDYQHIYYDSATASVFFIGIKNYNWREYGKIVKINPTDGSLISFYDAMGDAENFSKMKVANGCLYVIWSHKYVGGGQKFIHCTKYNMVSGNGEWNIEYIFKTKGGNSQAPLSLDLDTKGGVYVTGYCGSDNYNAANWGIVKFDGTNGNVIYGKLISEDTSRSDVQSVGMVSCVINNNPYFLGNLQPQFQSYYFESYLTLIKLEPKTGNTLIKRQFGGNYQFPCQTLYIEKYLNSQTLVMKQVGRTVKLEMYDSTKKILWYKNLNGGYFLFGGNLAVASNGTIYVSGLSKSESDYLPYLRSGTDSIFIFKLNNTGTLIKKYSFFTSITDAFPLELHADNVSALILYQQNNLVYYRKITSSTLSNEYNSDIIYNPVSCRTKYCFNKSTSKVLIFGLKTSSRSMMQLDKNTMVLKDIAPYPSSLSRVNYVLEIDTNLVIVCSKSNVNYESIGLYNTTLKDTIWVKHLKNNLNSQTLKCVTNPNKKFIYSISHSNSNIVVRKRSTTDGEQKWEYTYNGEDNLDDSPLDISYNSFKNQLLITGYETSNTSYKKALILVLDTSGNLLDTISKSGDFAGDNYAVCSQVLFDGTKWVGGNLNKNPYGQAGFIFRIADTSFSNAAINKPLVCQTKVYPNPFTKFANLEMGSCLNYQNAKLTIYNIYGQIIKQQTVTDTSSFTINRDELSSGTYFYQLTLNVGIVSFGKIIIVD